ncbi:MAG: hypothetical protein AB1452_00570 [Pseudomonadota bacterium]
MAWQFRTFVSPTGRNDVQQAVDEARPEVLEQFQVRVRHLANTQKIDWHEPEAKKLKGVADIYEIRFKAERRQHRPLGFFGPQAGQFTILVWAEKKQDVYKPADAINTASKRRNLVLGGSAQTAPLLIDGENFPPAGE